VAAALIAVQRGARIVRVETSSLEGQGGARRFYEKSGWRDAGGFDYGAEIRGGTIPVPSRRYEKRVR